MVEQHVFLADDREDVVGIPERRGHLRGEGLVAQLAALGVIGAAVFSLLFSLLGAGIGLLFLLGVGVFVLLAPFGLVALWLAVLADMGTSIAVTLNGLRLFRKRGA